MKTFDKAATDYLVLRRSVGFRFDRHEIHLREFIAFLKERGACWITTRLALQFATCHADHGSKTQAGRLSVARGFAIYMLGVDPRTEVPPHGLLPPRRVRAKPYIYTTTEVRRVLKAARECDSVYHPLRPWNLHCILGLLAVTGMRISEVVNLRPEDIDWERHVLTVRKTKFGKTRLVPLHASTMKVLAAFGAKREREVARRERRARRKAFHFFFSKRGQRYDANYIWRVFCELSREVGARAGRLPRAPAPRLPASLRGRDARALLSQRRIGRTRTVAALDVSGARPGLAHLLVSELLAPAHGRRQRSAGVAMEGGAMKAGAELAPLLEAFFVQRLMGQRKVSTHTLASYRDTFRLLLKFAEAELHRRASELALADLAAPFIAKFLDHLESARSNVARSRNQRLAAIRSFFRFAAIEAPQHWALIQRVLATPSKRTTRPLIDFLDRTEINALPAQPDRTTWIGRRHHALLLLAAQTGLRLSEIIGLKQQDVTLGTGAHVRCEGKGRKERATPLTKSTAATVKAWIDENGTDANAWLFLSGRGTRLSADAVQHLVKKYVAAARRSCPSLARKRVTPHVLRHTAAMELLQAGVDRSLIAIWLGHESVETTQIYLAADLAMKEQILSRTRPITTAATRYRPEDRLLAFLQAL